MIGQVVRVQAGRFVDMTGRVERVEDDRVLVRLTAWNTTRWFRRSLVADAPDVRLVTLDCMDAIAALRTEAA